MKKQSTLNLTIYLTISQLLLSFVITNNISINLYPKVAFFVPFFIGIVTIVFSLFLPKKILVNKCITTFVKVISSLYYILLNTIIMMYSIYILIYYFYPKTSFFLFTSLLCLIVILLSSYNLKHLYDVSLTIYIIAFLFNLILLLNTSFIDLDLIYNIDLNLKHYINIAPLILLSFSFEPIGHYIINIHENTTLIKRSIIISTLITSVISTIIIFINYLYYSDSYLVNTLFPSFSFIFSLLGPEFIDHFTIIILFNTLTYCLLKVSFNTSIIGSFSKKPVFTKILTTLIIFILSNLIYKYSNLDILKFEYLGLILLIFIIILYFFILLNKKEKNNASSPT